VRWLGRFALEGTQCDVDAVHAAAAALDAMPAHPQRSMETLAGYALSIG
jgi:hypothetical protein